MKSAHEIFARGRARRALRTEPARARFIRERAGLTQAEIAGLLGVDRSAVSRYESGRRIPSGAVLDRYAKVLTETERGEREN